MYQSVKFPLADVGILVLHFFANSLLELTPYLIPLGLGFKVVLGIHGNHKRSKRRVKHPPIMKSTSNTRCNAIACDEVRVNLRSLCALHSHLLWLRESEFCQQSRNMVELGFAFDQQYYFWVG